MVQPRAGASLVRRGAVQGGQRARAVAVRERHGRVKHRASARRRCPAPGVAEPGRRRRAVRPAQCGRETPRPARRSTSFRRRGGPRSPPAAARARASVSPMSALPTACSAIRLPAMSLTRADARRGHGLRIERPAVLDGARRKRRAGGFGQHDVTIGARGGRAQVVLHAAGVLVDERELKREHVNDRRVEPLRRGVADHVAGLGQPVEREQRARQLLIGDDRIRSQAHRGASFGDGLFELVQAGVGRSTGCCAAPSRPDRCRSTAGRWPPRRRADRSRCSGTWP